MSLFFPLVNFVFLVILYKIHRTIFWVTFAIEVAIYVVGVALIEQHFSLIYNQMLYMLALTGLGFIIAFIAFFIAVFLNNHRKAPYTEKSKQS